MNYEILSGNCLECVYTKRDLGEHTAKFSIFFYGHKSECSQIYTGLPKAMEMAAAAIISKRSVSNCGMRYISILSDGDAKTYQYLVELDAFGRCAKITKRGMYQSYGEKIRKRAS